MYFIANMEAVETADAEKLTIEYEVETDASVVGGMDYGPYAVLIWEFGDKRPGEKRKLCLRTITKRCSSEDRSWENATKDGYHHGGGIPHELVALASLFLRRRLTLRRMVRMDDQPIMSGPSQGWVDQALIRGERNLADLPPWFEMVRRLDPQWHLRFMLSARLYHKAIQMIEDEPDLAYLNLISAIETLCYNMDIGDVGLSEANEKLHKLVLRVEDDQLRGELSAAIEKELYHCTRRFVEFVQAYVEEEFWQNERPEWERARVDPGDFEKHLRRIYDQRSKTLHEGRPFPPGVYEPPMQGAEVEKADIIVGDKKWSSNDHVLNPWFFERIVNHVLKTFLKRHQVAKTST